MVAKCLLIRPFGSRRVLPVCVHHSAVHLSTKYFTDRFVPTYGSESRRMPVDIHDCSGDLCQWCSCEHFNDHTDDHGSLSADGPDRDPSPRRDVAGLAWPLTTRDWPAHTAKYGNTPSSATWKQSSTAWLPRTTEARKNTFNS